MKIISWNVNGIRAAYRNGILDWLKKVKPDVLCLQETKAQPSDFPDAVVNLPGYYFYHTSAQKRGYSGVAILCKEQPSQVRHTIGVKEFDQEGRFLLLKFKKFTLFNTYFPHSQRELARLDYKLKFNDAYLNFIAKLNSRPVVLTGDFNFAHQPIDLANPKQNEANAGFTPAERLFGDRLAELGWLDTYRYLHPQTAQYTWWTYRFSARARNIGWRIDYFFLQKKYAHKIKNAEIFDQIKGSDHCPISLELKD